MKYLLSVALCLVCIVSSAHAQDQGDLWKTLQPPEIGDIWVQPAQGKPAMPIWGHAKGLRVALYPLPGPRGLIRVYSPYMGQPGAVMINFIAVEPVVGRGGRGFSEMEHSDLDSVQGKRFWSTDSPDDATPRLPIWPARGIVREGGRIQTLTVYVVVEPYRNGAKVYTRLRFRSDRPHEAGLSAWTQEGSAPLEHCILTATMGNYARLRLLHLRDSVKSSLEIWPDFKGDGFTKHAVFPLKALFCNERGHALFIAAPNEKDPESATYAPQTFSGWFYKGNTATQYWRQEQPDPGLRGLVNGRAVYWNSTSPIPGGVAFENVDLMEPFRDGAEFWFGVTPLSPEEFKKREGVRKSRDDMSTTGKWGPSLVSGHLAMAC